MKKICLITPGHISSNPRLVKEAIAFSEAGYKVHLVFTQYLGYLTLEDEKILKANPRWTYSSLNWMNSGTVPKIRRYVTGAIQKISIKLLKKFPNSGIEKLCINRNYLWQLKEAISSKADLYIAHNLGALPVAKEAADINGVKSGFDAEDFHRNESSDDERDPGVLLNKIVEEKYLPGTDHLTAASPLIAAEYERLFPGLTLTPVLNVFPYEKVLVNPWDNNTPLKFFWFSQRIGKGRGLEEIIDALSLAAINFELHLLGDIRESDKDYFVKLISDRKLEKERFYFYPPISPDEIIQFASKFHIGLATETGEPHNRNICLTNKIFTYVQAGLAVIASDTLAQEQLFNTYPNLGQLYRKSNTTSLAQALKYFNDNPDKLNDSRNELIRLAQTELNWEAEQLILLKKFKK